LNIETIKALEDEAKYVISHAVAAFNSLQGLKTVQEIEAAFPAAAKFAARISGLIPYLAEAEMAADILIQYGPALFAFAHAAGIKPMDANQMAADESKFHPGYSQD